MTFISLSTINRARYFVLMAANEKNPDSHIYDVVEGSYSIYWYLNLKTAYIDEVELATLSGISYIYRPSLKKLQVR